MNPKFSIIVPIYNAEKYLDRCIQSILSQSYDSYEALLINDGSTDSSYTICEKYANQDSRLKLLNKTNGGVSSARNMGLNKASGEYIIFLDSDDALQSDLLTSLNSVSDRCIQLVSYNGVALSGNSEIALSYFRKKVREGVFSRDEYLNTNSLRLEIVLNCYSSEIIKQNNLRFSENIHYSEDFEFFIKFFSVCRSFCVIDIVGYIQYVNQGSAINRQFTFDNVLDHFRVIDNLKKFQLATNNIDDKAIIQEFIFTIIKCSLGFVSPQRFSLWVKLDLFYKLYFIRRIQLKQFRTASSLLLLLMFISTLPFILYLKFRRL